MGASLGSAGPGGGQCSHGPCRECQADVGRGGQAAAVVPRSLQAETEAGASRAWEGAGWGGRHEDRMGGRLFAP